MRSLIFLALLALATAAGAQFHGKAVYEVGTTADFVRALGSDRTLLLGARRVEVPAGVVVRGFRNLRILGAKDGGTELIATGGGAVLTFSNCFNIDLRQLTIRMESTATSAVLSLVNTTNVLVRDCALSGVAATGLRLRDTARVKLRNCAVLNCGAGILSAEQSRNVLIEESRFTRNEGPRGFELRRFFDLRLANCEFAENTFKTELVGLTGGGVRIEDSRFTDNRYPRTAAADTDVRVRAEFRRETR